MNESPASQSASSGHWVPDRPSFLATHRALAACTRELSRLTQGIIDAVAALDATGIEEKPVVRQSPGRCIVQLGPVALTMAWLRSTLDTAADGELMVVVWNGQVAPRGDHPPERTRARAVPTAAVTVWEDAFVAEAETEALWTWRHRAADAAPMSSSDLAIACVERLRQAYLAAEAQQQEVA